MTQREQFETAVMQQKSKHGMLCDLVRNPDGEYRSACERSAWWAWQVAATSNPTPGEPTAPSPKMCRECSGTGGIERLSNCSACNGTGKIYP